MFHDPVVPNETSCSVDCGFANFPRNFTKLFSTQIVNTSPQLFEMDFSSDDSIRDPDYIVSSATTESEKENQPVYISESILESPYTDTDENVQNFTQPPKNIKKDRQLNRNSGRSYTTKKGKVVAGRKCLPLESCRKKCALKVPFEKQKLIFEEYWRMGDYKSRLLFICGLVEIGEKLSEKKSTRTKIRRITNYYSVNIDSDKVYVCKCCFLKCFGETNSFLRNVIEKKLNYPKSPLADKRGKSTPINKLNESQVETITQHINSFPAYESHYCRRDSSAKYLSSDLSISKMYSLYCEEVETPISLAKYSEIFHTMNLKFKQPKLDTCNKCDCFKSQLDHINKNMPEYTMLIEKQAKHHADADRAYKSKDFDKDLSKTYINIKTYTFDLQQVLPTPYLKTSVCYYKRQLNTYNLTIYDCETNKAFCYMWHEAVGQRGANEISSCIFQHLKKVSTDEHVDSIVFYSDSCVGQNKNSFVGSMFIAFLESNPNIKMIEHKFLEPGHTHMECDVAHALIERKKKKTTMKIHHPRDWYQFVLSVGTNKTFEVIEMENKFYNFGTIAKNKLNWRKVNEDGEKFTWSDVKWLRYTKNRFGGVKYKTSLEDTQPFKTLNVMKRGVSSLTIRDQDKITATPLISKEKKEDLLSILNLIDPMFHSFYNNLNSGNIRNIDPDIGDTSTSTENIENDTSQ